MTHTARLHYRQLIRIGFPLISSSRAAFYSDSRLTIALEDTMKLKYVLVGLSALGSLAVAGTASAMPIGLATNTDIASNVDQVRLVCDGYGRCFRTYGYGYGYGPRYGYRHGEWYRGWHGDRRW